MKKSPNSKHSVPPEARHLAVIATTVSYKAFYSFYNFQPLTFA